MNEYSVPVYDFIGYKVLNVKFHRESDEPLDYFKLMIIDTNFNSETSIYELNLKFDLKFHKSTLSVFNYKVAFKINDVQWMKLINEDLLNNLFFSTSFPYIRHLIKQYTDDFRGSVYIPTLDLRNVDLKLGATYKLNHK